MTFDPSSSYRRKSSLVSSEAQLPLSRRPAKRNECIVHQFLESQRRAQGAAGDNGPEHFLGHPAYASPATHVDGHDTNKDKGDGSLVEPNSGRHPSRCVVDPESLENHGLGQPDQEAWTHEMTKTNSELDLMNYDDARSRTLTKGQLRDMAWGVRELSRRLSSMRIRYRVRTVFLLTKIYDQDLIPKTRDLTRWLLDKDRDARYTVYIQDKLKTNKRFDVAGLIREVAKGYSDAGGVDQEKAIEGVSNRLRYWDEAMCKSRPHTFDFVVTLGGDGTVLYASWLFRRIVPPVISFSLGSLGFMTKFDFDEYPQVMDSAFKNGVTVSLRLRFEGTVMRSQRRKNSEIESGSSEEDEDLHHAKRDLVEELIGEEKEDAHTHRPDGTYEILNEIVVDRGPNPSKFPSFVFWSWYKVAVTNHMPSHVNYRVVWGRRALHNDSGRRYLRLDPHGLYGL